MTNSIRFYEDTNSYHMDLLNGSIDIPKIPGVYNIATGCGSGKTTIIKQIIKDYYNEGVIVFCKTIRECNELYDFVTEEMIYNRSFNNGNPISFNDVINLCSEPRLEKLGSRMRCTNGVDLHWKDNLDMIGDRKIVIATHSVLMNTPIDKLMQINNTVSNANIICKGLRGIESTIDIRKFMLVDELPLSKPISKTYKSSDLGLLVQDNLVLTPDIENPGKLKESIRFVLRDPGYNTFVDRYRSLCKLNPNLKVTYSSDIELGSAREEMILSIMHDNNCLGNKMTEAFYTGETELTFKYSLPQMIYSSYMTNGFSYGINTNIWVFEGTGDITLSKPHKGMSLPIYRFMSYPNKYKGEEVDIIKIPNYLKSRNVNIDKMFRSKDDILESLDKNVELLKKIIDNNKETLIIVWKNLKAKYVVEDKRYNLNLAKFILNDEFNLPEYYKSQLLGLYGGAEDPNHKFHIVHYGSGLDLATNEFRDCDGIVRLGLFQIPNYALDEINDDLITGMNNMDFILYQNVQALSRTRIRNHKGEKVKFYISDDFDRHIGNLIGYLDNEGCRVREIDYVMSRVPKKVRENIGKLMKWNGEIERSILNGARYSLSININDLFNLIPMSKKESYKYSNLVSYLSELGVTLNIITNDWNKN